MHLFSRLIRSRNFIITLVLAVGLAPIYLFPEYFIPLNDVTEQLYLFILETKRMLSTGTPWWTWNSFLGDNFIASYAYYTITRPLMLALCLLPYKYMWGGLAAAIYLNFLIIGWLTSCYLRVMGFDRKLRLIGSLLFTLSTYMICQTIYCMFFEAIQVFLILLICVERFVRGRDLSCTWLTLASFAVAFVNYYFTPATFIAVSIYFLCRIFCGYREKWLSLTLKAAGCVCLGVLMAAVVLVPVAMYLSGTTRTGPSGAQRLIVYGYNWVLRALSLVAPTPHEGKLYLFYIDSRYNMNMAYVGIFGLFLYILYGVRHRRDWITILCAIYIVCLVTPLNGAFNLFTHPHYTRWCFALVLAVLVATLYYLNENRGRKISRRPALIYSGIAFIFLTIVYSYGIFIRVYKREFWFDDCWAIYLAAFVLFLLNTGALLLLTRYPILSRQWTRVCVGSIIIIAILHLQYVSYHYAQMPTRKNNIYEVLTEFTENRSESDTFSARTYFEPHPERQDMNVNYHIACNRPSVTTYFSTVNPATSHLTFILQHEYSWYVVIDKYYESAVTLLSVKDFDRLGDYPFTTVPPEALRGERHIPMGMAYDSYSLSDDSIRSVTYARNHDILRGMLASLVIDKADEPELSRYMRHVEFCDTLPFDSLVAARRAYTCDSFKGDTHGFTATVTLPDTMVVMFSTAADPGFTATIDGKPSRIYNVNMGMSASVVPAGRHTIRYEYFPPGLRTGAYISLGSWLIFLCLPISEYTSSRRRKAASQHTHAAFDIG